MGKPYAGRDGLVWPYAWREMAERLFAEGMSGGVIAAHLNAEFRAGLTRNAVIGKLHRLGLKRPPKQASQLRGWMSTRKSASTRTSAMHHGKGEQVAKPSWTPKDIVSPKPRHTHPVSTSAITGAIIPGPTPTEALPIPVSLPQPDSQPVTIDQLTASSCRWPIDPTPEHPEWRYCGCPQDAKSIRSPYCTAHWLRSLSGRRAA
jgi:GcrA cell cycle regulator